MPQVSLETGKINVYHIVVKQAKNTALESECLVSITSSATTSGVIRVCDPSLCTHGPLLKKLS